MNRKAISQKVSKVPEEYTNDFNLNSEFASKSRILNQ